MRDIWKYGMLRYFDQLSDEQFNKFANQAVSALWIMIIVCLLLAFLTFPTFE